MESIKTLKKSPIRPIAIKAKSFDIDWDEFKRKNKYARGSFEDLCYFLFCRENRLADGIMGYRDQAGIEKEPVFINKRWVGFQAKFFDHSIDWNELKHSIEKAKKKNANLQVVRFYINKDFFESSKTGKKKSSKQEDVEKCASKSGIEIEWFGPSKFFISLNKPENIDLAQLYFGIGDEFGFIKDSVNPAIQTFLCSSAHIDLSVADANGRKINNLTKEILVSSEKVFLISGHPGSGKSILMHQLFCLFGGLDKGTLRESLRVIEKTGAVPMRIDLKSCTGESLENIIRGRQNDYSLRKGNTNFIYLLDGLDELDPQKVEHVLTYIRSLVAVGTTSKIVFSCRSGNFNKVSATSHLGILEEYVINDLNTADIRLYFKQRGDMAKIQKLKLLESANKNLLNDTNDILLVQLLWETIESLNDRSTIFDLISRKIDLLLDSPNHCKNLESLNLLDLKRDKVLELNQEISFEFQKKFQFRFSREALQCLIMDRLPHCDYRSINDIVSYLSSLLFGKDPSPDSSGANFVYQHRRYQEFFFTQKLVREYEKDPKILRNLNVLTNREFLEHFFLAYLRDRYEKNQDVVGLLDVNLLDVYLGNHYGYGVDDSYHWNSSELLPALVRQNREVFNELWNDEDFGLKSHFLLEKSVSGLEARFLQWKRNKNDYRAMDFLSGMWSGGMGGFIKNADIFDGIEKHDISQQLMKNIYYVVSIYEKHNFFNTVDENRRPADPFWEHWESWMFLKLSTSGQDAKKIFNDSVRSNYKRFIEPVDNFTLEEQGKHRLVKGFFRALLRKDPAQFLALIDTFDEFELMAFLETLCFLQYLPHFFRDSVLREKIKKVLDERRFVVSEVTYFLGFYKTFFGLELLKDETEILEQKLKKIREESRPDWHRHHSPQVFSLLSYALGTNKFADITRSGSDIYRYYDELGLYGALFSDLILVGLGKRSIMETVRDYKNYLRQNDQRINGLYLKYDLSVLWAYIFSSEKKVTIDLLISIKPLIFGGEWDNVSEFSFCLKLKEVDSSLFDQITNETEIIKLETMVDKSDDYQSLVNDCFNLSLLFSTSNPQKSKKYFLRGMTEGILRHGWRKDTLVSYQLVDSLAILWEKNFAMRRELEDYARKVFALALRVGEFTDGKGTWRGPYNVVDLVARHDLPLATDFKNQLIEDKGYHNFSNEVITSILLGHIRRGDTVGEIEDKMREYRSETDYEGKPRADVFEQKIKVYVAIAESDLYTEEDRRSSYEKAYGQVEMMKKLEVSYYLSDVYFLELKERYIALCKKFGKEANVAIDEPDKNRSRYDSAIEQRFVATIKKADTAAKIKALYRSLSNYEENVTLSEKNSWQLLLNKTQEVCGSITLFIKLLTKFNYPHTDFHTANSEYFYFGLAIALSDPRMKPEALRHLYRDTGHGAFGNMIKVYAEIGDKEMCRKLFKRLFQLCDFLAN